ncbi:hypothetical protein ALC53_10058 [Atta colombica]|uniref:Uncharacterized protein n=1 Tax=Atta colombica TaxID=520822 RepID=A0A151I0U4_9HYME|nr:hypothetical protein ALC53_10058 [Atta colombica]
MKRLRDSIRKKRICDETTKLKLPLRSHRFDSIEEIQKNSLNELKAIPENVFQGAFEDWKNRWHVVVHAL